MATRGFTGRRPAPDLADRIPPGQSITEGFPVLSAGPTPRVSLRAAHKGQSRRGPKPRQRDCEQWRIDPAARHARSPTGSIYPARDRRAAEPRSGRMWSSMGRAQSCQEIKGAPRPLVHVVDPGCNLSADRREGGRLERQDPLTNQARGRLGHQASRPD
jgi:hypothetical protein